MLAERAAREHLNGTLFDETEMEQEEPLKETDLMLHDDDDDDEDPESTGTAVAEAAELFPTVAAQVERAERCLYLRCAYKHPPKQADAGPKVCLHLTVVALLRTRQASLQHNSQMRALKTEVEFPSILRLSHSTMSDC